MSKVLVIAEAGVNHNGDIELAKKLVDVASAAGADIVKFQTFSAENLATKNAAKADYQLKTTEKTETQFEMLKKLELSKTMHKQLIEYCEKKKIKFLSTGFDEKSIDLLVSLGIQLLKVPSGELTNYPYLHHVGKKKKQVILSTGMGNLAEVEAALDTLQTAGTNKKDITVLHCNTQYPTPISDVNLRAMETIKDAFKVSVGYSDHTLGIQVPTAAVALGATIIEKHFTLDREMAGPDHKASLEPKELKEMVKAIRTIEKALGDGIKKPSKSELPNIPIARKSIVAKVPIKKGEQFSKKNLTVKRPGTGISPMRWNEIIGQKARKDYREDDKIDNL